MASCRQFDVSDWLSLAAAPVFLAMALFTAAPAGGHDMAGDASPLGGMDGMYLLMALFHSPLWLKRGMRRLRRPPVSRTEESAC